MVNTDTGLYTEFKLINREMAFTIDTSTLVCGMNGAFYLVEMDKDGGNAAFPNKGYSALQGSGYCDAQCPHGGPYSEGGKYGSCCSEMDIWEANAHATQWTPHPCSGERNYPCKTPDECGDNNYNAAPCDKSGCGWNPYGKNVHDFYKPGGTVDTSRPFTVVTQFISSDGTDNGDLHEIKRFYMQDGNKHESPMSNVSWMSHQFNTLTDDNCAAQHSDVFGQKGGMKSMGGAFKRDGMVLTFSLWDSEGGMSWLDCGDAGPCDPSKEKRSDLNRDHPDAHVIWS